MIGTGISKMNQIRKEPQEQRIEPIKGCIPN